MVRKVFRVGHSYCVTLPKKMMREADIEYSDWVAVELSKNKKEIILRKKTDRDW